MIGRIITARHGRPDLSRDVKITAREYGDWWARYDESGLAPGEAPPENLVELAANAKTVISSTLPRAIETASMATKGAREVPADSIYVEAPLPPPPFPDFVKLQPAHWGVLSRLWWVLGHAPDGVESNQDAWQRVAKIAKNLEAHAEHGDVLLCAHGYLNWMIGRHLRKDGWTCTEHHGGHHYWSWRIYEPPGVKNEVRAHAAAE
ncbi:histidine phosphatase family protein [Hyphococcus sp. DH-69]|uniref:histidine phosphatase family protein n=1 Tax=Hyphococcus formosus TaxID=3143534 RepID=UPI00398A98E5